MRNHPANKYLPILCLMALFACLLHAEASEASDWDIRIGLGVKYDAEYEGSSEMKAQALPLVDITWKNLVFLNPRDGLGVHVYDKRDLAISVAVGYEQGRDESDSNDLRGMGDIDGAAVANLNMEYDLGPVKPYVGVSIHLGGSDGTLVEAGVEGIVPIALFARRMDTPDMKDDGPKGPALKLGISATWADDNYMGSYFSVSSAQSLASGHALYHVESGFKSLDFEVGVIFPFAENWAVNAQAGYSQLLGDAAESPIVKDDGQFSGGFFLSYRF